MSGRFVGLAWRDDKRQVESGSSADASSSLGVGLSWEDKASSGSAVIVSGGVRES